MYSVHIQTEHTHRKVNKLGVMAHIPGGGRSTEFKVRLVTDHYLERLYLKINKKQTGENNYFINHYM